MRTVKDNFWLDMPYGTGPALSGEHEADVAIIGGGVTGMAAAYFMKQRFPEKRIVVLESEFIGYGSSGRNSGQTTTLLGHNVVPIKKAQGTEKTARLNRLSMQAISLIEELIAKHGIDCDFEKRGFLILARSEKEIRLLEKKAKACEEIGAPMTLLDRTAFRSRFGGLDALAALHNGDDGMMNPGKFVRGMKRVVESLGVEIYEKSRCTHIETGSNVSIYTSMGHVRARDIVLATNAYNNPLGLFRYKVLPFYVYNIVTEPLTDAQMDNFQWPGRENIYGTKYIFWSVRPTADNRLLFIEVDGLYFHDIDRDYSHRPSEYRSHYKLLIRQFPFLEGIKVTHQWGGRVGMTVDFLPSVGRTGKNENIYYSIGYNGHGLAFSQLAGKMLAGLMAGEKSELTDNMLINRRMLGVPSATVTYLVSNGLKYYFKGYDKLLDMGKKKVKK